MSDPLGDAARGRVSPFLTNRQTINQTLEAARAYRASKQGRTGGAAPPDHWHPATLVHLKNPASSVDDPLPSFSVQGFGAPVLDPADDARRRAAAERPCFLGADPAADAPFCVTQEPLKGQQIGRAAATGVTAVQIDVTDEAHTQAVPVAGETDHLASAESGGVPILYKPAGTGVVWAFVLLGPGDAAARGFPARTVGVFDGLYGFGYTVERRKVSPLAPAIVPSDLEPLTVSYVVSFVGDETLAEGTDGYVCPDAETPGRWVFIHAAGTTAGSGSGGSGGSPGASSPRCSGTIYSKTRYRSEAVGDFLLQYSWLETLRYKADGCIELVSEEESSEVLGCVSCTDGSGSGSGGSAGPCGPPLSLGSITSAPEEPTAGEEVEFAVTVIAGSGDYEYLWEIDGDVSDEPNPVYLFTAAGEYEVTVVVFDRCSGALASKTLTVTVGEEAGGGPRYNCADGSCVEAAEGAFPSLAACEAFCSPTPCSTATWHDCPEEVVSSIRVPVTDGPWVGFTPMEMGFSVDDCRMTFTGGGVGTFHIFRAGSTYYLRNESGVVTAEISHTCAPLTIVFPGSALGSSAPTITATAF